LDKKVIAVIQARMGSSRLPGKSLMPVWGNVSLLEMVLRRVKRANMPSRVVLATPDQPRDDPLIPIAQRCGVDTFRGSENDVLGRFVGALEKFPAEAVVRGAADNPLIDPLMIDNLVNFFWEHSPCDYATNMPTWEHSPYGHVCGFPDGVGAEILSASTLRRLDVEATDSHDREHVTTFLHGNPDFCCHYLYAEDDYRRPQYRLDIDYKEDLEFVRELLKRLPETDAPFWTTLDIIRVLDKEPELLRIRKPR
jgi:spore coat polysaccharide biosynthesis protein SpsF